MGICCSDPSFGMTSSDTEKIKEIEQPKAKKQNVTTINKLDLIKKQAPKLQMNQSRLLSRRDASITRSHSQIIIDNSPANALKNQKQTTSDSIKRYMSLGPASFKNEIEAFNPSVQNLKIKRKSKKIKKNSAFLNGTTKKQEIE